MPDKSMISRVIDWLSVGYPKDVPVQDRAAVMAILKMRLTDEQLQAALKTAVDGVIRGQDAMVSAAEEMAKLGSETAAKAGSDDAAASDAPQS